MIYARMKAQSAFVEDDDVVELHAPGTVGLDATVIVFPANPVDDRTVGFGEPFENIGVAVFFIF